MKTRHIPIRTCVVCRQTLGKKALLRVVRIPEKEGGGVAVDPTGRANGRGAYVCASAECIDKAVKQKRFERSLSAGPVPPTLADALKSLAVSVTEKSAAEKTGAAVRPTGVTE